MLFKVILIWLGPALVSTLAAGPVRAQSGLALPTHGDVVHLDTGDVAGFDSLDIEVFAFSDDLSEADENWHVEWEICNGGGFAQSLPINLRYRTGPSTFVTIASGTVSLPPQTCAYFHRNISDPQYETGPHNATFRVNLFPPPLWLIMEASVTEDTTPGPPEADQDPPEHIFQPGAVDPDQGVGLDVDPPGAGANVPTLPPWGFAVLGLGFLAAAWQSLRRGR